MDVEYYTSGTIKAERPTHNGKWHGLAKFYNEDGQLTGTCQYRLGRRHGEARYYYDNGNSRLVQPWMDGRIQGYVVSLDIQGRILSLEAYDQDQRHGRSRYYDDKGNPTCELIFNRGELWGSGNPTVNLKAITNL